MASTKDARPLSGRTQDSWGISTYERGTEMLVVGSAFDPCRGKVSVVDPVTLILAALAAGAATGVGDAATQSIKDGYAALKALIRRRFAGNNRAEAALSDHEADPETYEKPLAKQLKETGADQDGEVLAAAEAVVKAAEQAGVKTKYHVTVTGGKVGIIGDHGHINTMN